MFNLKILKFKSLIVFLFNGLFAYLSIKEKKTEEVNT